MLYLYVACGAASDDHGHVCALCHTAVVPDFAVLIVLCIDGLEQSCGCVWYVYSSVGTRPGVPIYILL